LPSHSGHLCYECISCPEREPNRKYSSSVRIQNTWCFNFTSLMCP